jgi:hypothetical protein
MDADYYYAGGLSLADGAGFSENFLWNYLDDPVGLPHPSHAYWMPLASLLAAAGMKITGMLNFTGARLGFLIVAALVPPLTAALSYQISARRDFALLAGLLAAFPAFYLAYQGTTDNFAIYMLVGGLWFIVVGLKVGRLQVGRLKTFNIRPYLLGLLAGLMHLSRADGIFWLLLSFVAIIEIGDWRLKVSNNPQFTNLPIYQSLISVLLGYLTIMGPWMARNFAVFGTLLAPGGGRALWVAGYDELYAFPGTILTPGHWWASGLGEILRARGYALGQNLLRAFAVQGNIFLAPLILVGFWRLRGDRRVRLGVLAWLATLFSMTVIFPHQGWRGGFFHSGAAIQPLLWAAVPVGLEAMIAWGVRMRGWQMRQAAAVFSAGLVGLAILTSILVLRGRVIGSGSLRDPGWDQSDASYRQLGQALEPLGYMPQDIVAVNNPAGYYAATARPAIVIPDGTIDTLLAAARRFGARYILLEANHPAGLEMLFEQPADRPGLRFLKTVEGTHIFLVE